MAAKRKTSSQRREQQKEIKQRNRRNSAVLAAERIKNTAARRAARANADVRKAEQQKNTQSRRKKRQTTAVQDAEQAVNTQSRREKRQAPAIREAEQAKDTQSRRKKRQTTAVQEAEQAMNSQSRREKRQTPTIREAEQAKDTQSRRKKRQTTAVQEAEQAINSQSRREKRQTPAVREAEQAINTKFRREKRRAPAVRGAEKEKDASAKRQKRDTTMKTYEQLRTEFQSKKCLAPTYICSCCGGLGYEYATTIVTNLSLMRWKLQDDLKNKIFFVHQEPHRLCRTCRTSVSKRRIPKLALTNGFAFPNQPDVLKDLSPLEERLVSARLPFMKISLVGTERQSTLKGCVVNVENDLDICANVLPRGFSDSSVTQVKLMRRLRDTTPYMWEKIRPHAVYQAAKYLVTTGAYKEENIGLSDEWALCANDTSFDFVCSGDDSTERIDLDVRPDVNHPVEAHIEIDNNSDEVAAGVEEVDSLPNIPAEETLLFNDNESNFTDSIVAIAPGEGKSPIPLYQDLKAEELSFPKIYCGQQRTFAENLKITYTDLKKSELRMFDRRACTVEHILYSFNKSRIEKINNALSICLRKTLGNTSLTAGEVKSEGRLKQIIRKDEGYSVFKNIRSSPAYWQQKTKDVMGMIRQLGKSSLFVTLSAAETKWPELCVMLTKILKQENISEDMAQQVPYPDLCDMIRRDPVTCMTHFDHRYRALLNELILKKNGIFAPYEVSDYFTRMEFQLRGSPHIHGLFWLNDVPEYIEGDPQSEQQCTEFIDKFITCERNETGVMEKLIAYQLHKHSHSCYKNQKGKHKCRFGFPKPPMDRTRILHPLPDGIDQNEKRLAKNNFMRLTEKLVEMGVSFRGKIPFEDFLASLNLQTEEYIMAVRSSIKRTTPFLKRSTNAIFVNQYNTNLLKEWEANIDIQFVTDAYACAKYCVGYILKSESGVSKLLKATADDAKKGNLSVKDKLKKFAKILITGSEVSAQEAVSFLLGFPNTRSSRDVVYVSTSPPEERVKMLRPKEELDDLEDDSTDILAKGLLDRYVQRHDELENVCLADFSTLYEFERSPKGGATEQLPTHDCDDEMPGPSELCTQPKLSGGRKRNPRYDLKDGSGRMRERDTQKILRYRHYGKGDETGNYWREQMMLFVPWRSEAEHHIEVAKEKALENVGLINRNSKQYYFDRNIDEEELGHMLNQATEEDEEYDPVVENEMGFLDGEIEEDQYLESDLLKEKSGPRVDKYRPPSLIDDSEYKTLMRTLNDKQRRFVLQVLFKIKTSDEPFYYFLSGGAGVGKSRVVTAVIQSYLRYDIKCTANSLNPEQICVLVAAPTGKAAFNVFGMTLHSTFRLPPTQSGGKVKPLKPDILNSLRVKLYHVKLFIIDEISMVSVKQLYDIDDRLQQIFGCTSDFGGRSVILVGHLRQLPPVIGAYPFMPPTHLSEAAEAVENPLWNKFELFELDEIMRQRGDFALCKALNNMAEGAMDEADVDLIRSTKITTTNKPPNGTIWLFATTRACKEHNDRTHAMLDSEGALAVAHDKVQGSGSESEKKNMLAYARNLDQQKTDGLPYETYLKVGGVYFVSTNVDVQDGIFNGATGILRKIEYGTASNNEKIPKQVWIEFEHSLIGSRSRSATNAYQRRNNIPANWVRIQRHKRNLSVSRGRKLEVIREQIPLIAANGMTIHKSQGSSLTNVVVSVKGLKPTMRHYRELIYVACSRATSLKGLFIDGDFIPPLKPKANDPVTMAMQNLMEKDLTFSFQFLQDFNCEYETLYYQNVNSVKGKLKDIEGEQSAMSATYLAFVEPKLSCDENVSIKEYILLHKSSCPLPKNSEGMLLFGKNLATHIPKESKHMDSRNSHCQFVSLNVGGTVLVIMYRHPKYPISSFLDRLIEQLLQIGNKKGIFVGDTNINLMESAGSRLIELFRTFGYQSKLDVGCPTSDHKSHIDCCFSNCEGVVGWIYESYFSDHKPICVAWPKYN